jgi:6-hydroxy-3-succinoylpyridine 3-monooxygenase
VRKTPYKWLNLQRYFTQIVPDLKVTRIKYFTALVVGATQPNQLVFWSALRYLPLVEIIEGNFRKGKRLCEYSACTMTHPPKRRFRTREEKRTDVNIGVHMVHDAHTDACDHQVLISGDSDLVPPLRVIRDHFPDITLTVFVPAQDHHRARAMELKQTAHFFHRLPQHLLAAAQFPDRFTAPDGAVIQKPSDW